MNKSGHWDLLRSGGVKVALQQLEIKYSKEPDASRTMELGVAYLFAQRYESAWKHFCNAIDTSPRTMSGFYGMAGAAKWCLGEFDQAVGQWSAGLKAQYADAGGLGVGLPLLLFMASALKPATFQNSAAKELLLEKAKDSRIEIWPGPIASRILKQIGEEEFRRLCKCEKEADTLGYHWLADFYDAVIQRNQSTDLIFKERVRKLVDMSHPNWSEKNFFLMQMWNEEFFIARYEAR